MSINTRLARLEEALGRGCGPDCPPRPVVLIYENDWNTPEQAARRAADPTLPKALKARAPEGVARTARQRRRRRRKEGAIVSRAKALPALREGG